MYMDEMDPGVSFGFYLKQSADVVLFIDELMEMREKYQDNLISVIDKDIMLTPSPEKKQSPPLEKNGDDSWDDDFDII